MRMNTWFAALFAVIAAAPVWGQSDPSAEGFRPATRAVGISGQGQFNASDEPLHGLPYPLGVSGLPGGPGMSGVTEMPGMPGSGMPGMPGMSPGPFKTRIVTRTINASIMVPLTAEEQAELLEYQAALQALRNDDATPEQKAAAKDALAKIVERQFSRDLEIREKEIVELESRTKRLREQFEKRKSAKAEIVDLRMKMLLYEIDGLAFPELNPSSAPMAISREAEPSNFSTGYPGTAPGIMGEVPTYVPSVRGASEGFGGPAGTNGTISPDRTTPEGASSATDLPKQAGNLLKNPSFEDGAQGWGTGANPETVEYTVSDQGGVNGSQAARIHKTANRFFPISEWTQKIDYDGKSPVIELSAMVKTKDVRKAILDVVFLDANEEWIKHEWVAYIGEQNDDPQPLTHDFLEYKGAVRIPPKTAAIVIGLQDYGPGEIWFDDVKANFTDLMPKTQNNVPVEAEPLEP